MPDPDDEHDRGRRASGAGRPQRLILVICAVIVGYAAFIAILPLIIYHDPQPPWWYQRPLALFGLLSVPAVVGAIGARAAARLLVIAAGAFCLLQAFVSVVTFGFVVPALVLIRVGNSDRWPIARRYSRADAMAGVMVIALTFGACLSLFAFTGPRCWVRVIGSNGTLNTVEVPTTGRISVTDGVTSGSGSAAGSLPIPRGGEGCSSAEPTLMGLGVSATLAIGAIAVAAMAAVRPPKIEGP